MKKIITFIVVGVLMLSTNAAVFANSTTTSMSVGATHTGLVKEDGQLVMWGMNEYGEFGIGKTSMFKQGFTDSEKDVVAYTRKIYKELKELPYGFGATIGYSMIMDDVKTVDDAINEATIDMRNKKENH